MTLFHTAENVKMSREDYIARNRELFFERGAIQWGLHQLGARPLSEAERAELAALAARRDDVVIESLSRLEDPTEQFTKFAAARQAVAEIDAGATDATTQARNWFATHAFRRICDRAGRAEHAAAAYRELQARIDALVAYTDEDPMPRLDRRQLARLERRLDDVTTEIARVNSRLLGSYVKTFTASASRHDAEDYESAGMVGLMKAINAFDPDSGRFDTWAYKHIQREVLHTFRSTEYASMSHADFERRPAVLGAVAAIQARAGDQSKTPSYDEIAQESGLAVDQVRRVLDAPRIESLSTKIGDDGDLELADVLQAPDADVDAEYVARTTLSAIERHGLSVLDQRELLVITRRLGLDSEPEQRLTAIGQMLGRSREGVRQAEARAIAKLKHPVVLRRVLRGCAA